MVLFNIITDYVFDSVFASYYPLKQKSLNV